MHNGKEGPLKGRGERRRVIAKQEEDPPRTIKIKSRACIYVDKNHRISNSNKVTKITSLQ